MKRHAMAFQISMHKLFQARTVFNLVIRDVDYISCEVAALLMFDDTFSEYSSRPSNLVASSLIVRITQDIHEAFLISRSQLSP